jgi:hypothetical protein
MFVLYGVAFPFSIANAARKRWFSMTQVELLGGVDGGGVSWVVCATSQKHEVDIAFGSFAVAAHRERSDFHHRSHAPLAARASVFAGLHRVLSVRQNSGPLLLPHRTGSGICPCLVLPQQLCGGMLCCHSCRECSCGVVSCSLMEWCVIYSSVVEWSV